jgi:hypothetical protein
MRRALVSAVALLAPVIAVVLLVGLLPSSAELSVPVVDIALAPPIDGDSLPDVVRGPTRLRPCRTRRHLTLLPPSKRTLSKRHQRTTI